MKKHLIILFSILFFTACEKEEPKPCSDFLGMSFDYNGQRFRSEGKNFCAGFDGRENLELNEFLIDGADCNVTGNAVFTLAFKLMNFEGVNLYSSNKVKSISIAYINNGFSEYYTKLLNGQCQIDYFKQRVLTDAGYTKGYISGSFNFELTDSAFTDTFNITNGRFCISY